MDSPVDDISDVIRSLCQGSSAEQADSLNAYFLPYASFTHPFCRVPSFSKLNVPVVGPVDSRQLVLAIYQWYRILSPRITDLKFDSCAFDDRTGIIYVSMRQTFAIWFIPFYKAPVRLVTVLRLEQRMSNRVEVDECEEAYGSLGAVNHQPRWFITSQEDHYQVNEFVKFVLPVVGPLSCAAWQLCSTVACVVGVLIYAVVCRVLCAGLSLVRGPRPELNQRGTRVQNGYAFPSR